jgi:hypothetical protein
MWLRGPDLPDLLVDNAAEAKAATLRGYKLPSDAEIEEAEEDFAAQFAPGIEDCYEAQEFPKYISHPAFIPETPGRWTYERRGDGLVEGKFINSRPAKFAPVLVSTPAEEAEWVERGWTIGSAEALRAAVAHETADPTETSSAVGDQAHASPEAKLGARKPKLSGARRRKLDRERRERSEHEGAGL